MKLRGLSEANRMKYDEETKEITISYKEMYENAQERNDMLEKEFYAMSEKFTDLQVLNRKLKEALKAIL